MSKRIDLDELLAVHEAGHAVVAEAMGFEVLSAESNGKMGAVTRRTPTCRIGQWDDAMVKLAGVAAECIHLKSPERAWSKAIALTKWETQEVIDNFGKAETLELFKETVELLREQWAEVEAWTQRILGEAA